MATKKPRTRTPRATQRTPRSPGDRPEHQLAVLLEDVNARLKGLAEGQIAMGESLRRDMRDGFAEQGARIGRLESAVVAHSGEIRILGTRVGAVESGLGQVESRLGQVESRVGHVESRLGHVESRLGHVESRLGDVESRLGDVASKLDAKADASRVDALEARAR